MINDLKSRILVLTILFSCFDNHELTANHIDSSHAEKVNLAIRKTVDALYKEAGDSVSRIPAVVQINDHKWRVQLSDSFNYKSLPVYLNESFNIYGIHSLYYVAIKQCSNGLLDLGYHKTDVTSKDNNIPCSDRQLDKSCRYLEVTFTDDISINLAWLSPSLISFLIVGIGFYFFYHKKTRPTQVDNSEEKSIEKGDPEWIHFGKSRLDFQSLSLEAKEQKHSLTYREAKLLKLFATAPDQLLTRAFILGEVWENEGIIVGRSLDVFVSRLRKKLSNDETLSIIGVHGVGYKLEVKNPE